VEAENVCCNIEIEDGVLVSLSHSTKRVDVSMFMDGGWGNGGEGTLVTTCDECRLIL
jgi:hypothetical protein